MSIKKCFKLFSLILFFALSFLFCTQVLAAEPVDNLDIGIWHFDESDNVNAEDFSSYNHDLVWMYNPWGMGKVFPPRTRGKFDMGINFTQNEERYGLENFGSIDLSSGITLGAWIKTGVNTDEKVRILWLGNYRNSRIQDPSNFIMLSVQNGQVHLDLKQDKEWEREIASGKIVNDNEWHFLTVTLDLATQKMTLYVDGQFQAESSFDLPIPILEMLSIGMREYYYDSGILNNSGTIDDVWLRQEPMSEEKINNIFQSGQAYKFDTINYDLAPPSVFVNYDFDHINGTVALDSSANHYDIFWGYNMYSPTASPTPRLVPGKFEQGVNFKKDWEAYSRKFDPIKNFSQGFSSGIWIKTSEVNELPARIFWIGEEPKGRMGEAAFSDYLAVTEVDGKIKVDLNFYDGYFQDGRIMFKRQYSLNSKTFISDDTWHHIAVTLDSRPNVRSMKLYIDGILEDTSFFPGLIPPVDKLALGHREYPACDTQYNFNGTEDDFFIMNSVISDKDVKDIYESNSAFTWPIRKRNPVIIVPGIMGSAYVNGKWELDPIMHTYDNLWEALKRVGYEEGKDLFAFPYQWRDSNVITASRLKDKINEVKSICRCNKVDIVAHSMGGLVARYYIEEGDYEDDVDKLIFLATPHKGASMAYLMWGGGEFGSDKLSFFMKRIFSLEAKLNNYSNIFEYIKNSPIKSVQELLPIYNYLRDTDTQLRQYPTRYPVNLFLERLNHPFGLVKLENLKMTNVVVDSGTNGTVNNFKVVRRDFPDERWEYGYPENYGLPFMDYGIEYSEGDSTVPLRSNDGFYGLENEIVNSNHNSVATDAQKIVIKELTGIEPVQEVRMNIFKKFLMVRIFSPADFVIISPDGKRLGKDFLNNEIINEINGAFYSGFDTDEEFAVIPDPIDGEYKIELQGTGHGEYKLSTSIIEDDKQIDQEFSGEIKETQEKDFTISYSSQSESPLAELKPVDITPPIITIANPRDSDIYLHSDKFVIDFRVDDDFSGVASTSVLIDNQAISTTTVDLFDYSLGDHVLTVFTSDRAGNQAQVQLSFEVVTTVESTISDIEEIYSRGWLKSKNNKFFLETLFRVIRIQINFYEKEKTLTEKLISKTSDNKILSMKQKQKLIDLYNKKLEQIEENRIRSITNALDFINKQLDIYKNKNQINQRGYDIILSDINYLKINL